MMTFLFLLLCLAVVIVCLFIVVKTTKHIYVSNEEIHIYPHFLKVQSFIDIIAETSKLNVHLEDELDSFAEGRQVVYLDPNVDFQIFSIIKERIAKLNKLKLQEIEYRVYPKGAHMDWHRDMNLGFISPQYECILTLENTSDSIFQYKKDGKIHSITPAPNTLIIVRGNGIEHRVTPVTKGQRSILKFICR